KGVPSRASTTVLPVSGAGRCSGNSRSRTKASSNNAAQAMSMPRSQRPLRERRDEVEPIMKMSMPLSSREPARGRCFLLCSMVCIWSKGIARERAPTGAAASGFDHGDLCRLNLADATDRRAIHVLDQRRRHRVRARGHGAHQIEHVGLVAATEIERGSVAVVAVFLMHHLRGGVVLVEVDAVDHHAGPLL